MHLDATALPRTTLWGSTREFAFSVVRDADGMMWCGPCFTESCKHTALVASAIASGTAPAPVRRKASGGRRVGAGRPKDEDRHPEAERFWSQVTKTSTCWLWEGSINLAHARDGYGQFVCGKPSKSVPAHRWAYEQERGPISAKLVLDHLCRVTRCVRPDHLEPVDPIENMKRGLPAHEESKIGRRMPQ